MKTTFDLPEPLLREAKRRAAETGTTVKALVEEGLRRAVEERGRAKRYRLRRVTYRGRGLRRELAGAPWETLRDLAYKGRGA
jgi:hypothetical protein